MAFRPVPVSVLDFDEIGRALTKAARALDLTAPAWRTLPSNDDRERAIRRTAAGDTVLVRLTGRPRSVVIADMVEGIIASNHLTGEPAARARRILTDTFGAT